MNKYFIVICLLFVSLLFNVAQAQEQDCTARLYLKGDSVYCGKSLILGYLNHDKRCFLVDSNRIVMADSVRFYSQGDSFYANLLGVDQIDSSVFAKRVIEGKLNIYEIKRIDYEPDASTSMYSASKDYHSSVRKITYYNKGMGELKYLRYKNLKKDINDYPPSAKYLKSYRTYTKAQLAALLLAGYFVFRKGESKDLIYASGCVLFSFSLSFPKGKLFKKAKEAYMAQ